MTRPLLIGLALCLALTGCGVGGGTTAYVGGATGSASWSDPMDTAKPSPFDDGTISHVGTTLVVWSDEMLKESRVGCQNTATGMTVRGELRFNDGKKWAVTCESKDGKAGPVTVAGQSFELADGNLFLVSGPGDRPRVKQLKRDLSGLDFQTVKSLQAFGTADAEMTAFFTRK